MMMQRTARRVVLGVLVLLLAAPPSTLAQYPPSAQPPSPEATAAPTFRQEELDQLLAPIALYPDALLSQILMASTYPLEVVQADRWVRANPNVKGAQLEAAMQQQPWDPSVKSLTAFPQVLAMMDDHLDWTQKLGDTFLAQQQDVMATIQSLRAKAYAAGNLQTTPQQNVIAEPQVIRIVPAAPEIVYVPIYNPVVVYGPWWYPAYPPFYWYPPGYVVGPAVFSFGIGVVVGRFLWGGCDWRHHNVTIINVNNFNTFNRTNITNITNVTTVTTWRHNPAHRWGVPYRDPGVRQRFGQGAQPGVAAREAFRGRVPAAPQQLGQDGFGRRQPNGAGPNLSGGPQGRFGGRQTPEPSRPPELQRPGGRGASPPVAAIPPGGSARRQTPEMPRQPELQQQQRPGGGAGSPPAAGVPQGRFGGRQTFEPPRQPGALEGLGRGGEIRNQSDRGRMSRGVPGAAGLAQGLPRSPGGNAAPPRPPAPSAPSPRGPEVKGAPRPAAPSHAPPAKGGGERPRGEGGDGRR